MNKKPILVLTGLAVAAVAAVAGLTKDQWIAPAPQTVAGSEVAKTSEVAASNATQAAAPTQPANEQPVAKAEAPVQPAVEQPAPATAAPVQPAATRRQTAVARPEQPAPAKPGQPAPANPASAQPTAAAQAPANAAAKQPVASVQTQPPAAVEAPVQPEVTQPQTAAAQPEQASPAAAPAQPKPTAPAAAPVARTETAKAEVPFFDTVRVEKTGEAVIAGTAKAGSEVIVKLDGQEIGKTTANSDGAFVVVPNAPLPKGSGALTIEAKGKGDLQTTKSEQSVAVMVPAEAKTEALVAVVSPDAPTRILQKPEAETSAKTAPANAGAENETKIAAVQPDADASSSHAQPQRPVAKPAAVSAKPVSIDVVDYDSAGNIMFSGQGEPGHTARVYVDNSFAGDAPVSGNGRWTHSGKADIASGVHALRVDDVNPAGKVANRVEVPFYREEQSKVAAAVPEVSQPADQSVAKTPPATLPVEPQQQVVATGTRDAVTIAGQPYAGRVVIQPGNNLWRISRVLYGSGEKYTTLYQANKDQIRNPDLIYPGQIFKTPDVAAKLESVDPKRRDPLKPEENAIGAQ